LSTPRSTDGRSASRRSWSATTAASGHNHSIGKAGAPRRLRRSAKRGCSSRRAGVSPTSGTRSPTKSPRSPGTRARHGRTVRLRLAGGDVPGDGARPSRGPPTSSSGPSPYTLQYGVPLQARAVTALGKPDEALWRRIEERAVEIGHACAEEKAVAPAVEATFPPGGEPSARACHINPSDARKVRNGMSLDGEGLRMAVAAKAATTDWRTKRSRRLPRGSRPAARTRGRRTSPRLRGCKVDGAWTRAAQRQGHVRAHMPAERRAPAAGGRDCRRQRRGRQERAEHAGATSVVGAPQRTRCVSRCRQGHPRTCGSEATSGPAAPCTPGRFRRAG